MTDLDNPHRRIVIASLVWAGIAVLSVPPAMALKLSRKKVGSDRQLYTPIGPKERCPVCGMFVAPFPKWITQVKHRDGSHHSFDGVKCMMRFHLDPQQFDKRWKKDDLRLLWVRDYYTLKFVRADKAWFVVGSDVHGPMGHELIPFVDERSAGVFLSDHHGIKIIRIREITTALLDHLDNARKSLWLKGTK